MLNKWLGEMLNGTFVALVAVVALLSGCTTSPSTETTGSINGDQSRLVNSQATPPPVLGPPPRTEPASSQPARSTTVIEPGRNGRVPLQVRRNEEVTGSIGTRIGDPPSFRKASRTKLLVHKIEPHETLHSIARLYRTSSNEIAYVNRLSAHSPLHQGELLVVPMNGL